MPPKGSNIVVDDNHPFIEFKPITEIQHDSTTNEPYTVTVGYEPQIENLTPEILETGDLATLMDFWAKNETKLNENEKKYMQARIKSATEIEALKNKALNDIAEGKVTQGPELDGAGGYIGFSGLKSPGVQTSGNGCWSVAYSMLLKSRGVELDQAQIRGWRPDRTKDADQAPEHDTGAFRARNSASAKMNMDAVNSIDEMSDLMMQVLPNTSMTTVTVNPLLVSDLLVDGKQLNPKSNADQKDIQIINQNYDAQAELFLRNVINKAIKDDHSPVAIMHKGHYMTITGISPDGKTVRCEDSQGSPDKLTKYIPVSNIINDSLHERVLENGDIIQPGGFKLTWLHDLKVPEYDKKQEQSPDIIPGSFKYTHMDDKGNLNIDVPANDPENGNYGNKNLGQLEGKGIAYPVTLNMKELSDALGKNVTGITGVGGSYRMGDYDDYYPKKIYYGKDPELIQQLKAGVNNQTTSAQVYDGDTTQNMMNSALAQQMQNQQTQNQMNQQTQNQMNQQMQNQMNNTVQQPVNQTQPVNQAQPQTNATRDPQAPFDPGLINALKNLKNKGQQVNKTDPIATQRTALKPDLDNLIAEIKKDNRVIEAFRDPAWEQNINNTYNVASDLTTYCDNLVNNISNTVGINLGANAPDVQRPKPIDPGTEYINQRWAALNDPTRNDSPLEKKQMLAGIIALSEMGARQRVRGINPPVYNESEFQAITARIMDDEAFNRVIANGNDVNIIRSKDTKKFVSAVARTVNSIKAEKKYDISGREKLVQKRCQFIVSRMEATGTGTYTDMGIKRPKNDPEYEDALDAIRDVATGKSKSPGDIKKAVETVQTYLADKMTERGRKFGKERWGQCMMFLKETMPRKDFEAYCKNINVQRGVATRPSSPKYISPEMFGYKKEPVRCIIAETKHRILSGKGTERDYASLIALRNKYDNLSFLDQTATLENDNNRKSYIRDTERILKSPNFKRFMNEIPEQQKQQLLQGTCDGLLNYQNNLAPVASAPRRNSVRNAPQNTAPQTNNTAQPQTNNTANRTTNRTNNRTTNTTQHSGLAAGR